jgi:hypothetical protein
MKSAIGEGMTRKDHADVSNQLVGSFFFSILIISMFFSFSMQIMPLVKILPQ